MKRLIIILLFLFVSLPPVKSQTEDSLTFDKYNNQYLGLFAADFRFVVADSQDTLSLYNIMADSLIVLFYDPDCSHCKREIKKLRKDKQLNALIKTNRVKLLTIPPDITLQEWEKTVRLMPKQWINAWSLDNDQIIQKYLWKVPEMFVLDKDKRIVDINMYREDLED